ADAPASGSGASRLREMIGMQRCARWRPSDAGNGDTKDQEAGFPPANRAYPGIAPEFSLFPRGPSGEQGGAGIRRTSSGALSSCAPSNRAFLLAPEFMCVSPLTERRVGFQCEKILSPAP